MIRKFLPILLLAGLTACASNSRISSAPSGADTSGATSSANSGGGGDLGSGGGSSAGAGYGGASSGAGYGSSGNAYRGSGYGSSADAGSYSSQGSDCDAQPVQKLIGSKLTPDVIEQARKASGSGRTRILKPGEVMTMEYDPKRLNLILDKQDALTALRCG